MEEHTPSRFLGLTKTTFLGVVVVMVLIAGAIILGTVIASSTGQKDDIRRNLDAVQFTCSTTGVLRDIVQGVYTRTQQNVINGYYQSLLDKGLLTRDGYDQILKQQTEFAAGLKILNAPHTGCTAVKGQ